MELKALLVSEKSWVSVRSCAVQWAQAYAGLAEEEILPARVIFAAPVAWPT